MSSMQRKIIGFIAPLALCPLLFPASAAMAQDGAIWRPGTGEDSRIAVPPANPPAASPFTGAVPPRITDRAEGDIAATLQRWRMLRRGGAYSFAEYASFLMRYPGWPDERDMRRNAEQRLDLNNYSPSQAVAFFDRFPPVTNAGRARYALALSAAGMDAKAIEWGLKAWRGGPLTPMDESRLQGLLGARISPQDHDARIDALLWAGSTAEASRLLSYASTERRRIFEARLAMRNGGDGSFAGDEAMADPGYIADRIAVLRKTNDIWTIRNLLGSRPALRYVPASAEKWLELLLNSARGAERDQQYRLAYQIASRVEDGFAPGTVISDEALAVRDDYTSLTWLAGRIALEKLGQPADAARMFELYSQGARSPQTVTKGLYWAAKAARRAGDQSRANAYLERAAVHYDSFYGQMALEELGRALPRPVADPQTLAALGQPASNPLYMAASVADKYGGHQEQSLFLRAIANGAKTEREHLAAIALSKYIGRPDLSVMAGRNARVEGYSTTIPWAFPTVSVPSGYEENFSLIHAIARQESQFDRAAISHAGARGLMQLMPGTARETARMIDLVYTPASLTEDTHYNIRLGSTYIDRMLRYYNGSYPLAVAAYNAGPGNVNKWLAANGDPRTGSIDMITWIENIPIFETRNYVHRVLENAVMYDLLNPERARFHSSNAPLFNYLGFRRPQ